MSSTGVRKESNTDSRIIRGLIDNEKAFVESLKPFSSESALSGLAGSGSSSQNSAGSAPGNYLPTRGGTMIGSIAFFPIIAEIANDRIDISDIAGKESTRIILNAEGGSSIDDLIGIDGALRAGQLLNLQGTITETITIKHLATGGNIRTFDSSDVVLSGNQNLWFIFDTISNQWAQIGGAGGSGGSGHTIQDESIQLPQQPIINFVGPGVTATNDAPNNATLVTIPGVAGSSFPQRYPLSAHGTIGSVTEIFDWDFHGHTATLSGDIDVAFTNHTIGVGVGEDIRLHFFHDGLAGDRVITFPPALGVKNLSSVTLSPGDEANVVLSTDDNGVSFTASAENGIADGGGEFFGPWTATHDAGTRSLTNLASLQYVDTGSVSRGTISGDSGASALRISTASGGKLVISDVITDIAEFDDSSGLKMLGTHVLNMNKNMINSISEAQFDRTKGFTPGAANAIAFDNVTSFLKYNVGLNTDAHAWYAAGELLASISRIGTNSGQLSIDAVVSDLVQVDTQLFFGAAGVPSPLLNGAMWRNALGTKIQTRLDNITEDVVTYIPDPLPIKGDLLVRLDTGKFRELLRGSNGKVLTVDDTEPFGLKWETPEGENLGDHLATMDLDLNGNALILDVDGDSSIASISDDSIQVATGGSLQMAINNGFVTIANSLIINANTTLGDSDTDLITPNGTFVAPLKIATGGGTKVAEVGAINSSPDIYDINLESNIDFRLRSQANNIIDYDASSFETTHHQDSKFEKSILSKILLSAPSNVGGYGIPYFDSDGVTTFFRVRFPDGTIKIIADDT